MPFKALKGIAVTFPQGIVWKQICQIWGRGGEGGGVERGADQLLNYR